MPTDAQLWLSVPVLALLGACIGSFLNVVRHRLPAMLEREWWHDVAAQLSDHASWQRVVGARDEPVPEAVTQAAQSLEHSLQQQAPLTLAKPRSRCPACGHAIRWYENIPIVGWLMLKGRCSACGTSISLRYPLVEALTALLFGAVGWRVGAEPLALLWCAFVAVLVAAASIDWDTTLLPDNLTLPLLWGGLMAAALGWTIPLQSAVWGAVAGYLSLWSVYRLYKALTGKIGMGHGDFKLLAALGAWLGVQMLLPIVLAASILGAVAGIAMKLNGSLRDGLHVPFGPFLAGAGVAVMLIGPRPVLGWLGWG